MSEAAAAPVEARPKPRFRGVLHKWAFLAAIPGGVVVGLIGDSTTARAAGAVFAASVVAMFGASALYHRVQWTPERRRWMRRVDHAGIFCLIAGTYTPFGLLVLHGNWRIVVLAIGWSGAGAAVAAKLLWIDAPKWISAVLGITLGWGGVLMWPQLVTNAGLATALLVLLGGVCYTVGAIVYALRKPDFFPSVFGYHEIFHALVIAAVVLQYVAVALVVDA